MSSQAINQILGWLPFIVLVAFWIYYMRVSRRYYRTHVERVESINERTQAASQKIAETNLEIIGELREIKQILKDRK